MQGPKSKFDRILTIRHLPTLPHILLKLLRACNQFELNLKEVSAIIEKDPALTGRILSLSNSANYAMPPRIQSVDQAVAYLGTRVVKNVAMSASVFCVFNQIKVNSIFNMKFFWWHSLRCAVLARLISKKTQCSSPDEAFLSGLLHDIGKLVLWVNFRKEYEDLLKMYKPWPDLLMTGEIRLAGTHSEIGSWLLSRWNLKSFMADSVLFHHEPLRKILGAFPLVQVVHVANALSKEPSFMEPEVVKTAEEVFGFSQTDIERLLSKADEELERVAQSLDIGIALRFWR